MKKYTSLIQENLDNKRFNKIIDFTYLKNDANVDKIKKVCNEAKQYGFYSVCIKPDYVAYAKDFLKDSDVKICTVISFPDGDDKTAVKIRETEKAIIDGADEIDMVMDYKLLKKTYTIDDPEEKQDELDYIKNDIAKIARLCHGINSVVLKVIIESGELTMEQVKDACKICVEAGADFVKTSTGFARGAEVEKVKFMRKILPDSVKIKASGGIRTIQDIEKFVKAGADRVGTSSNPSVMGM